MDHLRSDIILRDILEERKTLTGFLDAVFGFMSRNTDFYHVQNTKDDKLGFPIGVKEQILMSCMQKYERPHLRSDSVIEPPFCVGDEVEIATEQNEEQCDNDREIGTHNNIVTSESLKDKACYKNSATFSEADYKNGSLCENYCWSQSFKDVELNIILPKEVKLAKHIKVKFKGNHVTIKTLFPKEEILIDAETWDKYRHNDVIWSILEGKLVISFDKMKECWWDKLFLIEKPIDIKSVDTIRSIDDYSPYIQSTIHNVRDVKEIPSEPDLKTLSLNKSEHLARLRQAWNADGSPFKGQSFDPSIIEFT